jgi:hypothetical protein
VIRWVIRLLLLRRLRRWRREAEVLHAVLRGDVEALLRRKLIGRLVLLPLYRRFRYRT